VVGGAASLLTRVRLVEIATLLTALAVFGAIAEQLPDFGEGGSVAAAAVVVLPAIMATIWLALPLGRVRPTWLLVATAVAAAAWVALYFAGSGILSNLAKLVTFTVFGFWFLSLFEFLWWVALVALVVPWIDAWSVATGPTKYVTEEQPALFDSVSVEVRLPGETETANIGPPDFVFFALFLAATQRFGLRTAATWICMTGFLSATLVLVWAFDSSGLPALPAVCFGFLIPNADLLWRHAREAHAAYSARRQEAK
jgi:hypothetical protein